MRIPRLPAASGCSARSAACRGSRSLDRRRGPRAPILLWLAWAVLLGAADSVAAVEGAAPRDRRRPRSSSSLRRRAGRSSAGGRVWAGCPAPARSCLANWPSPIDRPPEAATGAHASPGLSHAAGRPRPLRPRQLVARVRLPSAAAGSRVTSAAIASGKSRGLNVSSVTQATRTKPSASSDAVRRRRASRSRDAAAGDVRACCRARCESADRREPARDTSACASTRGIPKRCASSSDCRRLSEAPCRALPRRPRTTQRNSETTQCRRRRCRTSEFSSESSRRQRHVLRSFH